MKRILFSIALASMTLMVGDAVAEEPENAAQNKRAKAGQTRGPVGGPQRDPAKMVARIMQEFDTDGDQKLDKTELAAWLKVMQQRRGQAGRFGKGKPGAEGKRRRGDLDNSQPGGERPKRPEAE